MALHHAHEGFGQHGGMLRKLSERSWSDIAAARDEELLQPHKASNCRNRSRNNTPESLKLLERALLK